MHDLCMPAKAPLGAFFVPQSAHHLRYAVRHHPLPSTAMPAYADIPQLIAQCKDLPLPTLEPRRALQMSSWQEEWHDQLAMLDSLMHEAAYGETVSEMASDTLQDACLQWENAAQTASTLLRLAVDRGVPAPALRSLYVQAIPVWREYAWVLQHARDAGCAPTPQAIRPETAEYPFALQLLCLGVLLDEEGEIPAIVEHLLHARTDRLLDYLSAAAIDLQEASDDYFHTQPFEGLNDFLDQYGEVLPDPLLPYLEQHYSRFFALSPAAQKTQARLTGPQAWGWWALEVGALVALYGLDDIALREHPHYPADLVDYALGVRD